MVPDPYEGLPDIGVYSETLPARRSREQFYDEDDSDIKNEVARVVAHEGPIHQDLLVRRVARMFQLMRTGHNVDHRIRMQIKTALTEGKIRRYGAFLWPRDAQPVKPRRPAANVPLRDIEHVPPEELEAAALLVARLTRGIREDELARETPRVLGYSRITANIEGVAAKAIKRLLRSGALVLRGDHLFAGQSVGD